MLGRSYDAAVTSEPEREHDQRAHEHRHPAAEVGDPADQREHRDVPEQEAGDDRRGPLQLVDAEPDPAHHVRQREDDHVGVGGREGHRDRGQAQQQAGAATGDALIRLERHGAVMSWVVPYSSKEIV